MIDLHTHTNESDGTFSPTELIDEARRTGLEAMAITDHDTMSGYELARGYAKELQFDLICGIELSTRFHGRSVHLLGLFPCAPPSEAFRGWLADLQTSRHERNVRMTERLRSLGVDITLDEVQAQGRSLTGRPHFARVLLDKGYVSSLQQAFHDYLDESAKGYVERQEADFGNSVRRIREAGGVASLAHPIRLAKHANFALEETLIEMRDFGLMAIEVYHSDHKPSDVAQYESLARRLDFAMTGGSDFHGGNKPNIKLGTGAQGNLHVPLELLTRLRTLLS